MGNTNENGRKPSVGLRGNERSRLPVRRARDGAIHSSSLSMVFKPPQEYVIGGELPPPSEYVIQQKWSPVMPMEESDIMELISAFRNPDILKTVHNDTFNADTVPRNWSNAKDVERFAKLARNFWMPKDRLRVKTMIPWIEGDEVPENKTIAAAVRSFVVRVDGSPVHAFRVMDNDPYASLEEREKIDKGELRVAHQESMITLPRFQRQGIAAFGTIQTYDALLGKDEQSEAPFDRVTMLINLAESNTANFFMNHGFEIFNLIRASEDGGDEYVSQSVMMTNQNGEEMRMMRLMMTQKRWLAKRNQRIEKLQRETGIDLSQL